MATAYQRIVDKRIADGPFALPAELQHAGVEAIVAWLHAHIRYTGIELSDAELVPWTPAEVTARGFGDCKDKASLLVAMLRAAGVTANVALLDTGPGIDLDPGLPGLGVFDHAIVREFLGGKDVCNDATESGLPVGQLPIRDQGRRALIAATDTRDLKLTPAAVASDNAIRVVRTYHAKEADHSSVTEVSTTTGIYVADYRTWLRDTKTDDIRTFLKRRAERTYHGELGSYASTDLTDLAKPFALTVEFAKSTRVYTEREQIDAYLYPADALMNLPAVFEDNDPPAEPRLADYRWTAPHRRDRESDRRARWLHGAGPATARSGTDRHDDARHGSPSRWQSARHHLPARHRKAAHHGGRARGHARRGQGAAAPRRRAHRDRADRCQVFPSRRQGARGRSWSTSG